MAYAKTQDYLFFLETMMRRLIEEDIPDEQIKSFLQQINKPFDKYVFVANIQVKDYVDNQWMQPLFQLEPLMKSGMICSYKQSLFILFTHSSEQFQFEKFLNEWLGMYAISTKSLTFGYSSCHVAQQELAIAVREAYYARIMAEIEAIPHRQYQTLASDSLLIELHRKDAKFAMDYVNSYLGPILEEKADPDLIKTAITYIRKKREYQRSGGCSFLPPKHYSLSNGKNSSAISTYGE